MREDVPFTDLDHGPLFRNAVPRYMQQLPRERVEDDVHPAVVGLPHEFCVERCVPRVEDARAWDLVGVDQVLDLVGVPDRNIYLQFISPSVA